ncbi:Asp23/Gls24 family envelope stress response protein [Antrihabitans spumae]|uniref:Asp23/Gls24 family envelope stress response protein n=1 Tax=Antrihabitans spumae TaxID=3373370 RepID=A0ABW7JUV7_9NOCA
MADHGLSATEASGSQADDPGQRGTLTIKNRAAMRIVEISALEIPGVIRSNTRLGNLTGRDLPRAVVDMASEHPNIRVDIAVEWPSPIAAVCGQVRDRVVTEVVRLTGRHPSRVDVAVADVVANIDTEIVAELPPPLAAGATE